MEPPAVKVLLSEIGVFNALSPARDGRPAVTALVAGFSFDESWLMVKA
jgi:hypothetical protein